MVTKVKTIIAWVILILFLLSPGLYAQHAMWSSMDTTASQRDTTRYYVFDVKERTKCDTSTVTLPCPDPSYAAQGVSCLLLHYKTVVECNDTTWAPKIQIWLTPIELEQLMELIGK